MCSCSSVVKKKNSFCLYLNFQSCVYQYLTLNVLVFKNDLKMYLKIYLSLNLRTSISSKIISYLSQMIFQLL